MRVFAAAASAAIASALTAAAAGCYATGERAQGAQGYPAVEYKPCCDGADQQLPKDGDWGLFCTKPAASCYATGERAQGAEGYPYVEYKPCCDGADQKLPKDGDWGLFCTKSTVSCYATGERAQGAQGYPPVEYKPCCDGADQQLPKDGDWGLFCTKPTSGGGGGDGEGGGGDSGALPDGAICETGAKGAPVRAPCAEGLECRTDGILSALGICAPPGQDVTVGADVETKCGNKADGSGPTYTLCKPNLECLDRDGGGLDQPQGDNLYCVDTNVQLGGVCDIGPKGLAVYRRCARSEMRCYNPVLSTKGICVLRADLSSGTRAQLGDSCGVNADGTSYLLCDSQYVCENRGSGSLCYGRFS